jgi:hypothetical protein
MTEPKSGLAGLELKDNVRLRWTLHDIKSQRTKWLKLAEEASEANGAAQLSVRLCAAVGGEAV